MAKSDINDASKLEFSSWLSKEVGAPSVDEKRVQQVLRVLEQSRANRLANETALAVKITAVGALYGEPVALPTEKLDSAKKAFVNMAQELTAEQWLKFSFNYAKEVNDNLKALQPAADAASAPASGPATSAP